MHEHNCFLTLTYNDENLPGHAQDDMRPYRSLDRRDLTLFLKRLRKKFTPKNPHEKGSDLYELHQLKHGIRFYGCGEYGEKFGRPHYHLCLFNFKAPKLVFLKPSHGLPLYTSEPILERWQHQGHITVGSLTFESAAYTARYMMKKINGDLASSHYETLDSRTGEIINLVPEFSAMSRKGGIGLSWLKANAAEVYNYDNGIIIAGAKTGQAVGSGNSVALSPTRRAGKPPRYYDQQYEIMYPSDFENIKRNRAKAARAAAADSTPDRLAVREFIKKKQIQRLTRTYESDE